MSKITRVLKLSAIVFVLGSTTALTGCYGDGGGFGLPCPDALCNPN